MDSNETNPSAAVGRSAIATIDAMGWGVFFIWMGGALVANVGWGIALLGAGAISLGVQLTRRLSALPVDRGSVGVGACLFVAGLLLWLDLFSGKSALSAWLVPAVLIIIGASIIVSAWTRWNA
jgi:hypothetical protein